MKGELTGMRLWGYAWVDGMLAEASEVGDDIQAMGVVLRDDSVGVLARSCLFAFWGETLDEIVTVTIMKRTSLASSLPVTRIRTT